MNELTFWGTHMSAGKLSHNSGATFWKAWSPHLTLFVFGIISNESSTDRISWYIWGFMWSRWDKHLGFVSW